YGYEYPSYDPYYTYFAQPNVTTYPSDGGEANYQPQPAAPPAVVNGNNGAPPPPQRQMVFFLIALKNGQVYSALAYWPQDKTLNFVDMQGTRRQVPLTDVDAARSESINRQRGVDFGLPK
ncbi:MAG: hypothetical protein ABSG25_05405, partial [Bryobacteraceae bacterium]